jgi:hypothetical protein
MQHFYGHEVKDVVIEEKDITHEIMRNVYKISMIKPEGKK